MEIQMDELIEKAIQAARGRICATVNPDETPKAAQAVLNMMQAKALYKSLSKPTQVMEEETVSLLKKVRSNLAPTEMMKATQAVVNIMHANVQLDSLNQPTKTTKAAK